MSAPDGRAVSAAGDAAAAGRAPAQVARVAPHLETGDELGVGRRAATRRRLGAQCTVLRREFTPLLHHQVARSLLAVETLLDVLANALIDAGLAARPDVEGRHAVIRRSGGPGRRDDDA